MTVIQKSIRNELLFNRKQKKNNWNNYNKAKYLKEITRMDRRQGGYYLGEERSGCYTHTHKTHKKTYLGNNIGNHIYFIIQKYKIRNAKKRSKQYP